MNPGGGEVKIVRVNGNEISGESIRTINDLLLSFGLNENRVVVELNGNIVSKEDYRNVNFNYDDTIEVISFVGGG